jgi:hypothetical protein
MMQKINQRRLGLVKDFKVAELRDAQLDRIKSIESELQSTFHREIALVLYEKSEIEVTSTQSEPKSM